MLTVAVLGPVEVRRDGELLAVPSGKTTEVLVRLALEAGRLVPTERLIEDLWAEAAVSTGRNTLQSKVSQLRRALDDPGVVTTGHGGYLLAVDEGCVDALEVVDLAAAATEARRSGDAAAALDAATSGLARFRGEVLVDVGEAEWLQVHRVRFEELRLGLIEDQLAARVDLGAGGEVIGELEALVDRHPMREGLWASLITALYRAGRQADALQAYQRVRRVLVEELGVEPGPGLRALEDQILQQSPTLDIDSGEGRSSALSIPVGNLPALTSPLVGRAGEIAALGGLLHDQRLVTLVGPAGVGKTRTAIEVARAVVMPGGAWLVRLDGVDPGTSIAQAVAEALHLPGGEPTLVERLAGAETLLVLDNCEHLVDAVADVIDRLLDATTSLRVLATSQVPLGLDGEVVFALEPLPMSESMALFARRAGEIRKQFVLDDDTAATVEEVCASLDGLPLAIELAAARVKSLSVQEIARRLDDRFALLQDPTSRRPERRRALAGAIAWSYELLFPDDQRGLWALSCFVGGAPLDAAEHVLGALDVPEGSVVDVVGRLVDRSLVSLDVSDDGSVRYRLLDSIRAFALDRLADSGHADDAGAAHAAWFAQAAGRCAATVRGELQADCVAAVRADRANIDAALAWCARRDAELGVRIANGFGWTWVVLGDGVAGATRVRDALDAADPFVDDPAHVTGLLLAGWLEASAGDVDRAEDDLARAQALAVPLPDDRLRADVHRHLAFLRIQQGRPHDVLEEAAAALDGYRGLDLPWEQGASRLLGAFGSIMLGDTANATRSAEEALGLIEPTGDSWGLVHAEAMLGGVARAERRFDAAAASLSRAAAESERLGFLGQAALHLTSLGRVEHQAGHDEAAVETLHRAIAAAGRSGDLRIAATARVNLARALRSLARADEARGLLEQADAWYRSSGGGDGALLTRVLLASMASTREGRHDLTGVLDEARRVEDREVEVLALDALARVMAEAGDAIHARQLLDTADQVVESWPHVVDDADRLDGLAARTLLA